MATPTSALVGMDFGALSGRTVRLARSLGEPVATEPTDIDALDARYQNVYGR